MITFDQLCHDARCTQAEREILARYLALLRYEATLRLGRPNDPDQPRAKPVGSGNWFSFL